MGPGDRKRHSLVLSDRAPEHRAARRVRHRSIDEPAAVADALRRDQDPFRVHPVEDVAEPHALLADQVLRRDLQALDEHLIRVVVEHRLDRHDAQVLPRAAKVDEEGREAKPSPFRLGRRRPGEQQHQVTLQRPRGPDLLAVDHVAVAVAPRARADRRRVEPGVGLRDRKGLQSQFTGGNRRQIAALLFIGAVPEQRPHHVHLSVAGPAVGTRAVDLLTDHRCLRDARGPRRRTPRGSAPPASPHA